MAPTQHGNKVTLAVAIPGHPIMISGLVNTADHTFTGTFRENGKSQPLTLQAGSAKP